MHLPDFNHGDGVESLGIPCLWCGFCGGKGVAISKAVVPIICPLVVLFLPPIVGMPCDGLQGR